MFGMTGVGKSTLRRIILEDEENSTLNEPFASGTKECYTGEMIFEGQPVVVVDTPGLYEDGTNQELVVKEIKRSIELAKPGPHVFLYVEKFDVITRDKLQMLQDFQDMFGKKVMARTVVVFTTYGEVTSERESDVVKERITSLTKKPSQAHFVFNFDDKAQKSQVKELFKKITEMKKKQKNIYTPKMLQEAEKDLKRRQKIKNPRTEEEWFYFYDRCGLYGMIVGGLAGYFICGGELTSSVGAALGAGLGMTLFMGIAYLAVRAKIKIQKCY